MLESEGTKEILRRQPTERPHRHVVGTTLVGSELPTKVGERIEAVGIVKALLVFSVAALDLAIMAGRIGPNHLVADAQVGGSRLEERLAAAIHDGEAIGKLRAVVGLDAFDLNIAAGIPDDGLF